MRVIIRSTILAVALAALSMTAGALDARSDASRTAAPSVRVPPAQVRPEPEPRRNHGRPSVRANPDPLNPAGDVIEISIAKQRLTAWRDGTVVYRFVISTGRPGYETPTGHYEVLHKIAMAWSRKWSVWMPWGLHWHGNYFIHQLPHKPGSSVNIGASRLGTPDSHGCVRVNVGDAEALFRWASVGTPVWVH